MKKYLALAIAILLSSLPVFGVTVTPNVKMMKTVRYTVSYSEFKTAGVTSDINITTLPPKTALYKAVANITTTFACASVCTTNTLSFKLGKSVGGAEYLLSFDADAATGWFGDADNELGASITAAVGPDFLPSATVVKLRLTSGTGNIGTGSATNLSGGIVDIYLTFVTYP
jgi:hypothetical protein